MAGMIVPRQRVPTRSDDVVVSCVRAWTEDRVTGERDVTFGAWLEARMADQRPPVSRAEVKRRTGVSLSTVSRWINDDARPTVDNLTLLAPLLSVGRSELLLRAGYSPDPEVAAAPLSEVRVVDPLAAEIDRMLDPASPLTEEDRHTLRILLERMVEPHRKVMKRRRPA